MSKFDSKEDMIDYLVEVLDDSENTTVVVDYIIAKELSKLYEDEDFDDYFAIDIASDCNEYLVEKVNDNFFCIEPAKNCGIYLEGEPDKLIILDELINDDLLDAYEYSELEIVNYENDDIEDSNSECGCNCDCCNCYYDEYDKVKLSEFEKLNDAQKDYLFTELSDMEEINLDEIAKICLTFYDDGVNSTLLKTREILATLEK